MIKEITIQFNGVDYKVKRTNRALMQWEELTGLSFEELKGTLTHMLKYFYAVLIVNNDNFRFSFDDFVDMTDEDPTQFNKFQEYLIELALDFHTEETSKKKVTKKVK